MLQFIFFLIFFPFPRKLKNFLLCIAGLVVIIQFISSKIKKIHVDQLLSKIGLLNSDYHHRVKNKIFDLMDWVSGASNKVNRIISNNFFKVFSFLILIGIWLCFGFFVVKLNEEAVIMRFGCLDRICKPGLNWHLPWPIEHKQIVDVTTLHKITVATNPGHRALMASSDSLVFTTLVLTSDENMLSVQFTIFWRVKNIANYLFKAKSPNQIVESAAEAVMRQIISNTRSQDALTAARQEISSQIKANLQKLLDEYMIGIEIVDAQIGKIDPPESVIDAYREVLKAKLEGETKKNEAESYASYVVPQAEGEAFDIYSKAKVQEVSIIANAEGQRDAYLSSLKSYEINPELAKQIIYVETVTELINKCGNVSIIDKNVPMPLVVAKAS